ncbi:FAD-binding oxidoreductase [Limibacillus sp. MBR-115]|uniref:NAD(P)/FAD-dependent oxidoreductase n=1 Tax=Limibacillus sp. MBR-115 TaxID=3156465 RepID=UPI003391B76D
MNLRRIYHPSAFDPSRPPDSHWRATATPLSVDLPSLEGDHSVDFAVIGGGFTGLWAAYRLAETYEAKVMLLDAGEPAWGASGRNGGFCCLGSTRLSYPQLEKRYGETEMRRFYAAQVESVENVRGFLDSRNVQADRHSAGELALAHKPGRMSELREEARYMTHTFGMKMQVFSRDEMAEIGVAGPEFHGGIFIGCGFALHPLTYARALATAALAAGAAIHQNSPVIGWSQQASQHVLTLPKGRILAKQVILATNGYGSENMPSGMAGRSMPVMSNILVTRPLTPEEQKAQGWTSDLMAYDSRRLLHYFRLLPDGRFLFGGRGGIDASPAGSKAMNRRLRRDFERMFPAWAGVPTERFWFGFVCLTYDLVPYVGAVPGLDNAWTGFGFHGNGVAMSSWTGKALADLAAGAITQDKLPAVVRGPLRRFPLPALRKLYLRAAYLGYGLEDRWL